MPINAKVWAPVGIASVAVALFFVDSTADKRALREVRRTIAARGIDDTIYFQGVDYNLFTGAVTLENIEVEIGGFLPVTATAESMTVADIDFEDGLLVGASISFNDLVFDVVENVRKGSVLTRLPTKKGNLEVSVAMVAMGYGQLTGDLDMRFEYDVEEITLELAVAFDGDDLGTIEFDLALEAVRENLLRSLTGQSRNLDETEAAAMDLIVRWIGDAQQLKKDLGRLELANLRIAWEDDGLRDRMLRLQQIQGWSEPGKLPAVVMTKDDRETMLSDFEGSGISRSQGSDWVDAISKFFEGDDSIAMETHIDEPVRFARLIEVGGARAVNLIGLEITN